MFGIAFFSFILGALIFILIVVCFDRQNDPD